MGWCEVVPQEQFLQPEERLEEEEGGGRREEGGGRREEGGGRREEEGGGGRREEGGGRREEGGGRREEGGGGGRREEGGGRREEGGGRREEGGGRREEGGGRRKEYIYIYYDRNFPSLPHKHKDFPLIKLIKPAEQPAPIAPHPETLPSVAGEVSDLQQPPAGCGRQWAGGSVCSGIMKTRAARKLRRLVGKMTSGREHLPAKYKSLCIFGETNSCGRFIAIQNSSNRQAIT